MKVHKKPSGALGQGTEMLRQILGEGRPGWDLGHRLSISSSVGGALAHYGEIASDKTLLLMESKVLMHSPEGATHLEGHRQGGGW